MYALRPTITGLPLTRTVVGWLPCVLHTTSVLPLALGVGSCMSIVITSWLPLISAFMVVCILCFYCGVIAARCSRLLRNNPRRSPLLVSHKEKGGRGFEPQPRFCTVQSLLARVRGAQSLKIAFHRAFILPSFQHSPCRQQQGQCLIDVIVAGLHCLLSETRRPFVRLPSPAHAFLALTRQFDVQLGHNRTNVPFRQSRLNSPFNGCVTVNFHANHFSHDNGQT